MQPDDVTALQGILKRLFVKEAIGPQMAYVFDLTRVNHCHCFALPTLF